MKKIILISSMTMLLVMLLTACSDKSTTDDMASDADTDNDTSTSNTNSGDNEDGDNTKDTTDGVDDTSTDAASDLETTDETVADETTDDTTASTDEADQTEATQVVYDFEDQFMMPASGEEVVVLHTNFGEIKLRLFPEVAPLAVENFLTHVKDGYYDGLTFHRVMADFMIQGGDPNGDGSGGESIYEGPFADEFTIEYLPYRGALCMANSGANTNGSQFFVVQSGTDQVIDEYVTQFEDAELPQGIIDNYKTYGGTPWLFYVHTTFGQVYEGMDVVDAIAAVAVDDNAMPAEPVIIESAEAITYE